MEKKEKPPYKTYNIVATVKSVHGLKGEDTAGKGPCRYYRPGDKITFKEGEIDGTICYSVLATMMYKVLPMRAGFDYPWAKEGVIEHACPDAARPVVFQITKEEVEPESED
jgi:uncharacterized repeat protein (TIGR04076 family)